MFHHRVGFCRFVGVRMGWFGIMINGCCCLFLVLLFGLFVCRDNIGLEDTALCQDGIVTSNEDGMEGG